MWIRRSTAGYVSPPCPKPEQPNWEPLQVLRRTDQALIIYDARLPAGNRTVRLFQASQLREALAMCEAMYKTEQRG